VSKLKRTIKKPQKKQITSIKQINPKVWISTLAVFAVLIAGVLFFDTFYQRPLLTIGDDKYYKEDLMYYFYTVEQEYSYSDQLYQQLFGSSYWDMPATDSSTKTMRDVAKDDVIELALKYEVLYQEATNKGYALTAEEEDTIATEVDKLLTEGLTEEQVDYIGFTSEYLTDMIGKKTLVDRYYKDVVDSLDIDDAAIKAEYSFEDYKQYDIEYFFISTNTTDDDGNSVAMSDEEKSAAYDKINGIYETVKTTEDWSKVLGEDEKELIYRTDNFIESDTTFDDDFEAKIMAMENDTVSDIYEAENGYYIVRMINNSSTEKYDETVNGAITKAETEGFNEVYTDILKNYKYKVGRNALQRFTMGQVTIPQN
jgi:foldase protein PrsA